MSILETGVDAVLAILDSAATSSDIRALGRALGTQASIDRYLSNAIGTAFDTANATFKQSTVEASRAGQQIEDMGWDLRFIGERLITTIIPESLSWLEGDMILHVIDPIRAELVKVRGWLGQLFAYDKDNTHWRNSYVDPNINNYIGFHKFFNGWPLSSLNTLHDWLQHPAHFADYVVPIVARPLVDYYAGNNRKPLRDYLTLTVVSAFQEEPNKVFVQILEWLVTDG